MISNVIFDLGGVIERINPKKVAAAFFDLGVKKPEEFFSLLKQSSICSKLETGEISEQFFIKYLKSLCGKTASEKEILEAWNSNQMGVSKETVEFLEELRKKGILLYLLSNTNIIHFKRINSTFRKSYGIELSSLFNGIYYSFQVGLKKPDIRIYSYLLKKENLDPENTLYVDDLQVNLKVPSSLGMNIFHHPTNTSVRDTLCFLLAKG